MDGSGDQFFVSPGLRVGSQTSPRVQGFVGDRIAWLVHGEFLDDAPGASGEDDTPYGYLQATWRF